jgi:hypothetical protein
VKNSIRNLVITLALLCTLAAGQNVRVDGVVQSRSGHPAPGASVAVCTQPANTGTTPCYPLAPLCSSLTDTACAQPNPVTADGLGNYHFYVATGQAYTYQFSGSALTTYFIPDQTPGGATLGQIVSLEYPNSSDGTICNGLAKIDQTSGSTTLGRATSTSGSEILILGVVEQGCGTSGFAILTFAGPALVIFDTPSPTVGDAIGVSSTIAGAATDLGSASPTGSGAVIGQVTLSAAGTLPSGCTVAPGCLVQLYPSGPNGGGGGGSTNALVNNPGSSTTNTVNPTGAAVVPITPSCNSGAGNTQSCFTANNSSGAAVLNAQNNGQVAIGNGTTHNLGSNVATNTDLDGTLTMSSGTNSYTFVGSYSVHPTCVASDETSIAAVKVTYTGTTSVTFTTSGSSDVIDYHCMYRN